MKMNIRQLTLVFLLGSGLVSSNIQAGTTLKTDVRKAGQSTTNITLTANQVFILHGFSVGGGDKVQVIFTSNSSQNFNLNPIGWVSNNVIPELIKDPGASVPIRGPGKVSISGKGLVSYSVDIAK